MGDGIESAIRQSHASNPARARVTAASSRRRARGGSARPSSKLRRSPPGDFDAERVEGCAELRLAAEGPLTPEGDGAGGDEARRVRRGESVYEHAAGADQLLGVLQIGVGARELARERAELPPHGCLLSVACARTGDRGGALALRF